MYFRLRDCRLQGAFGEALAERSGGPALRYNDEDERVSFSSIPYFYADILLCIHTCFEKRPHNRTVAARLVSAFLHSSTLPAI